MTFGEYIEKLNQLIDLNQNILKFLVVSSSDPEGNWFEEVIQSPTIGFFDNGEFTSVGQFEEFGFDEKTDKNSVCIN